MFKQKPFLIIDTPGIFTVNGKDKETEEEIKKCISSAHPGPHVVLFVIEIGRITAEDLQSVKTFLGYFGQDLELFIITVFTHADNLNEQHTLAKWLADVPELQQFLDECEGEYCIIDNTACTRDKERSVNSLMNQIFGLRF